MISTIQEKEREITECQTNLDQIKQHASDLQTFLTMKNIQRDVSNNEQFIVSLLKEAEMNQVDSSFEKKVLGNSTHHSEQDGNHYLGYKVNKWNIDKNKEQRSTDNGTKHTCSYH